MIPDSQKALVLQVPRWNEKSRCWRISR